MKKYMGTAMTIFAGVVIPLFCVAPLVASFFLLKSISISTAVVLLMVMNLTCTVVCSIYLLKVWDQLYTWAAFQENCVVIQPFLKKKYILEYAKCSDIGVGCYTHGVLNSNLGTRVNFIYLSYDGIDKKYIKNMNLLHPTKTFVKMGYSEKMYCYLLKVLPTQKALILRESYTRMQCSEAKIRIKR